MPSPKTTFWLGLLVVLTSGYLYFFETKMETTGEARISKRQPIKIKAAEIEKIKIWKDSWTSLTLERVDEITFKAIEPYELIADIETSNRLLSTLENLQSRRVLEDDDAREEKLFTYGLSPPQLEISVATAGMDIQKILLGNKAAGGGLYLRNPEQDSVHLVDESIFDLFNKALEEMTVRNEAAE